MMGVRGSGLPRFGARSGSAATNPREWPRPRPGRDIEIRRVKNAQTRSTHCSTYGVTALSVGLNAVPGLNEEMGARAEDATSADVQWTKVHGRHLSIPIEWLDKRRHDHVALGRGHWLQRCNEQWQRLLAGR